MIQLSVFGSVPNIENRFAIGGSCVMIGFSTGSMRFIWFYLPSQYIVYYLFYIRIFNGRKIRQNAIVTQLLKAIHAQESKEAAYDFR